ncbi:phage regulatory CII family protein [Pseudomonas aeruginosa]|uniref:phage regulatory CII family protein n=1 Tax=Pseudomonas aeruginosa TaxID=287 RepID=UPI00287C63C0|nr:phage regulatory CII family protein [Pseudomonas aeruginosa]MDS9917796.1 phage regulatory CII family protein [Pseudomonas aeruginosa]
MSRVNHHAGVVGVPRFAVAQYLAGREYRGGLKALSIDMGMDYDLLQAKLNPSKAQYLTPEELERFMALACSNDVLLSISKASGSVAYRPIPMNSAADKYRALSLLSGKCSEIEGFVAEALEQEGTLTGNLYPHLEKLLLEYAQIVLGIVHGAQDSARAGQVSSDPLVG